MEKPYLLTYEDCGESNFAWFYTEEDMYDFITDYRVNVIQAFLIRDAELILDGDD
ncbi:hypothetical protein ACFHWD_03530 [Clostridium sp. MT-14]|uniref:hypothetical protein n=1 Tax=Clostridium sp. MT-14 TaxID=3348360 RepID=UPI0035F4CAE0